MNQSVTEVIVEQPLALPGSANITYTDTQTLQIMDCFEVEVDSAKNVQIYQLHYQQQTVSTPSQ